MLPTEDLFVYVCVMADDAITSAALAIPRRPVPAPACWPSDLPSAARGGAACRSAWLRCKLRA